MKAIHYIMLGIVAVAGFIMISKRKGQQQYVVTEDIILPPGTLNGPSQERPQIRSEVTRVSSTVPYTSAVTNKTSISHKDRIATGDVVIGKPTQQIVYSPPGTIGPQLIEGVNINFGDNILFVPHTSLNQVL